MWHAWEKGYKLGVQASSDHVSTHISYAGFYVDRIDRESIIAAMKARRSYAATDNIFVDLRMGGHFMGESFATSERLALTAMISGTGPIERVEVIKNNRIVYTAPGNGIGGNAVHLQRSGQPAGPGILLCPRGAGERPAVLELADLGGVPIVHSECGYAGFAARLARYRDPNENFVLIVLVNLSAAAARGHSGC